MTIALLGYGRMGRTIDGLLADRGHEAVLRIDETSLNQRTPENLRTADVAIEFSVPDAAVDNILACLEAGIPVVSGTTAWLDRMDEVKQAMRATGGTLFYAPNFSIGVNLFFHINQRLAMLMNDQPQYDVEIDEVHHTGKIDAPSGTAIRTAEVILGELDRTTGWSLDVKNDENDLLVRAFREPDVPGTHVVRYLSDLDELEIRHTARSREAFARGAIRAAEWVRGRTGYFEMSDLLGL